MYDDNESPYRCPLCLTRPSLCTTEANTGLQSVGCMTCNCGAPVFTQDKLESKYMPLVKWDKWVSDYRKEHPEWHRELICKGCIKYRVNHICSDYDQDCIRCPEADYREIEEND